MRLVRRVLLGMALGAVTAFLAALFRPHPRPDAVRPGPRHAAAVPSLEQAVSVQPAATIRRAH